MKHILKTIAMWLKKVFTRNLGMKIGAVVFAMLLWMFVQAEENPIRQKTFEDVPVTFTAVDVLSERELTSATPLADVLKTAVVTVEAATDSLQYITKDTVSATVDLSSVTEPGEYTLEVNGNSKYGGTVSVNPRQVEIKIEAVVSKMIPVELEQTGTKNEELYYGDFVLSSDTVEVQGARSNVEQVRRAVCRIDVTDLTGPSNESRSVILLDEDENELPADMFTNIPSVIVDLPIYPQKTVNIDTAGIKEKVTGIPEGFEVKSVEVTPNVVQVVGRSNVIDNIQSIELDLITLDGDATSQTITVVLEKPEQVYMINPQTISAHVTLVAEQIKQDYPAVEVAVKNLGDEYEIQQSVSTIDVAVEGTKQDLDEFNAELLKPFLDVQGLQPGMYSLEVKFENEPDLKVKLTPSARYIAVTITRKEE